MLTVDLTGTGLLGFFPTESFYHRQDIVCSLCVRFLLPFRLTSGIIRVCLDLTGLFRSKDIRPVLMIRLARRGARKQPHYRIVVIEKERATNGRPVEVVGTYNPRTNPASVEMKRDRVEYWVSKGAQMSERVNKLFSKAPAPAAAGSAA